MCVPPCWVAVFPRRLALPRFGGVLFDPAKFGPDSRSITGKAISSIWPQPRVLPERCGACRGCASLDRIVAERLKIAAGGDANGRRAEQLRCRNAHRASGANY